MRAGLASRMLAGGLDGLVLLILLTGSYCVWAALMFLWSPSGFRLPTPSRPLVLFAGYLFAVGYLTFCWWISGRTYGDQVLGLRVLGRRGRPLGLITALARAALCALLPLGLLWTAVSRDNRSLADLLLRTSVVYDWRTVAPPAGIGGRGGRPAAEKI
jgi:uncharacterized RDD family membrane protein YckC